MILLGVLLILVAVGAAGFVVMASPANVQVSNLTAVGVTVAASPLAMFITGAASIALLGLGFVMVSRGTRRKASSRKELHQLRKGQAAGASTSTAEKQSSRPDRPEHTSSTDSGNTDSTNTDSESPSPR